MISYSLMSNNKTIAYSTYKKKEDVKKEEWLEFVS